MGTVMHKDKVLSSLPTRLVRDLQRLARKYQGNGLDLFVFGSFARGDQRPTSDLDLGVEWRGQHNPETFLRLYWEVQELPTIRKIDLVDFEQADSDFRRVAMSDRVYLSTEEVGDDESQVSQKRI